jgi:hypothetical protein
VVVRRRWALARWLPACPSELARVLPAVAVVHLARPTRVAAGTGVGRGQGVRAPCSPASCLLSLLRDPCGLSPRPPNPDYGRA